MHRMAEACHSTSPVSTSSYFKDNNDIPLWIARAENFQDAGADMLELNFSSAVELRARFDWEERIWNNHGIAKSFREAT